MCCQGILPETARTFLAEQCKVDEDGNRVQKVIGFINDNPKDPLHRFYLKNGSFVDEVVQRKIDEKAAMIALADSSGQIIVPWPEI